MRVDMMYELCTLPALHLGPVECLHQLHKRLCQKPGLSCTQQRPFTLLNASSVLVSWY